ncbi:MAG: primosomal protein [Candidatus Woesearchaeota archaeon]
MMEKIMKLLIETVDFKDLQVLTESSDNGCKSSKVIRIKGPFILSEVENKNNRKYKRDIIAREVKKFNEEKISQNRALGQLDHPQSPTISLDRVSHKIESLEMDGNVAIGVAKIVDTPVGNIAKALILEGVLLGVSTRGIGTVGKDNWVNDNFKLITIDLVAEPSAPNAFVESILENKEYIIKENGDIVEVAVEKLQKRLDKEGSKAALDAMNEFIKSIK